MYKLLSANFARLWKNIAFWLAMTCLVISSLVVGWMNYQTDLRSNDITFYVENVMFNLIPMQALVCACFISLFLGTEFDENTIRNKLIVGHTRTKVFFSNYITCVAASIIQLMAMLLLSGIMGYILFKEFLMPWTQLSYIILCCIMITAALSAICTGITVNINSKATSVVVTLILMFLLLFASSYINSILIEPEMTYDGITMTIDGTQYGNPIQNPAYVGGTLRRFYEFIYDLLPTGQAIQINTGEFENCTYWPLYSLGVLIVSTILGYSLFRKRDIK